MESSGFENRNRILSPTGEQWLTVPVYRGRDVLLKEVRIANDQNWQRKHWRSIELAYQKAPFWNVYAPGLSRFYNDAQWTHLVDLTHDMLRWFMNELGMSQRIVRASSLAGLHGTKSELVLSMCQAMHATEYLFGAMGRDYADVAAFERAGIKVRFQDYQHPTYPQLRPGFVPTLSIIDLLFNVGPRSLAVLVNGPAQSR